MTLRHVVVPAAFAVSLLAGCGDGSQDPGAVVERAIGTRTAARCELYTDAFFEREVGTSPAAGRSYCRRIATALPAASARITRVQVAGASATVTAVAAGRSITYRLVQRGGRWLIDALDG